MPPPQSFIAAAAAKAALSNAAMASNRSRMSPLHHAQLQAHQEVPARKPPPRPPSVAPSVASDRVPWVPAGRGTWAPIEPGPQPNDEPGAGPRHRAHARRTRAPRTTDHQGASNAEAGARLSARIDQLEGKVADLLSDVLVGVEHLTGYVERHSVRVMADDRASLAGGSPFDAPGDDAAEGRIASVLPTASASNDPTEPIAVPPIAVPPAAPALAVPASTSASTADLSCQGMQAAPPPPPPGAWGVAMPGSYPAHVPFGPPMGMQGYPPGYPPCWHHLAYPSYPGYPPHYGMPPYAPQHAAPGGWATPVPMAPPPPTPPPPPSLTAPAPPNPTAGPLYATAGHFPAGVPPPRADYYYYVPAHASSATPAPPPVDISEGFRQSGRGKSAPLSRPPWDPLSLREGRRVPGPGTYDVPPPTSRITFNAKLCPNPDMPGYGKFEAPKLAPVTSRLAAPSLRAHGDARREVPVKVLAAAH